eukprot:3772664-Prymnesium_polylepis.1
MGVTHMADGRRRVLVSPSAGHYVVIDHAQSAVVLAVRGTMRLQDVLTDLVCEQVDLSLDWVGAEG